LVCAAPNDAAGLAAGEAAGDAAGDAAGLAAAAGEAAGADADVVGLAGAAVGLLGAAGEQPVRTTNMERTRTLGSDRCADTETRDAGWWMIRSFMPLTYAALI